MIYYGLVRFEHARLKTCTTLKNQCKTHFVSIEQQTSVKIHNCIVNFRELRTNDQYFDKTSQNSKNRNTLLLLSFVLMSKWFLKLTHPQQHPVKIIDGMLLC